MRIFSCAVRPTPSIPRDASDDNIAALAFENGSVQLRKVHAKPSADSNEDNILCRYANAHNADETLRTAWDETGEFVLSAGGNATVNIFSKKLTKLHTINLQVSSPEDQAVYALWYSKSPHTVRCAYHNRIATLDTQTAQSTRYTSFGCLDSEKTFRNADGSRLVFDACESDARSLVVAALSDGSLGCSDTRSDESPFFIKVVSKTLSSCCFSHSQNQLLVTSMDGQVSILDSRKLSKISDMVVPHATLFGAVFSPKENEVFACYGGDKISLCKEAKVVKEHYSPFQVLNVSQNENVFVACGEAEDNDEQHGHSHSHFNDHTEKPNGHGDKHCGTHHIQHDHGRQHKRSGDAICKECCGPENPPSISEAATSNGQQSKRNRLDMVSGLKVWSTDDFWTLGDS